MEQLDLHFPGAGVDVSAPVGKQPARPAANGVYARTCAVGRNCRAYDALGRARGGIRPGLEKYLDARPGGTRYATQELAPLVTTGDDPGGGDVQPSQSGRLVLLVAVAEGNVYTCPAGGSSWTAVNNATGETPPLNATGLMQSAANNQRLFFADGTNRVYLNPVDNNLYTWDLNAGDFPVDDDGNYPRLICTWRGRTVLSGLFKDPSVLFMSKISDPFDFNYFPDVPVPPDTAWSGQVGPQGLTGDVVTGLIPYTDDILIIGMDSSIAMLRGDPQSAGAIDLVTSQMGMAWGQAWCMDPQGTVYFFGNNCRVYAFVPGQQPVPVSGAIDNLLEGVDTGEYGVRLLWNDRQQGVHVFVTLLAEEFDTTHYFWEQRSNAWWVDTFADTAHNPLACCTFDGNDARDRVALVGGWDGYVRSVSSDAADDDGEDIESEVWIGPFLTRYSDSVMLKEIQGVMGADSADVDYAVFVGETAEEALGSTPVVTGTWSAGRNYTDTIRRSGYAAYVQLQSVGQWAMESIRCLIEPLGTIRRRGK